MSKKIWVTGAAGLLGTAIQEKAKVEFPWLEVLPTYRGDLDYTNVKEVQAFIQKYQPDMMINCIAYTDVDGAERDRASATIANVFIPDTLSKAGIPMIHIGTDYLFDGGSEPFKEESIVTPVNAYAETKHEGEKVLMNSGTDYYLLRTSWLYGPESWRHKSFYKSIRRKALEGGALRVVTDEVSAPTSVFTLARVVLTIATQTTTIPLGVYNIGDQGVCSRHDFARAIVELDPQTAQVPVLECLQSDLKLSARRPHFSKLSTQKIEQYLPELIRPWQDALKEIYHYDHSIQ